MLRRSQDIEGDENFHLWSIAAAGDGVVARDVTPGDNVKASNLITNKRFPDELLVGTNERDPAIFDMYRVQYKTGDRVLDTLNPGDVLGWGTEDALFQVRDALVKSQEDSSETIRVRDDAEEGTEWRDLITHPVRLRSPVAVSRSTSTAPSHLVCPPINAILPKVRRERQPGGVLQRRQGLLDGEQPRPGDHRAAQGGPPDRGDPGDHLLQRQVRRRGRHAGRRHQ